MQAEAKRVGLTPDLLERRPFEVSEGQLQRACLARALIAAPRYLLCDEPTSMLDVSTQAALLAVIDERRADDGIGILLISHDRTLLTHWCDQVLEIAELSRAD